MNIEHLENNDFKQKPEVLAEKPVQQHIDYPGMTEHEHEFLVKYFSFILYFRDKYVSVL